MTERTTRVETFMGSPEIPLSPDEYRLRYRPQDVPHVYISNPNGDGCVRVDLMARNACMVSVLIPPRQGCHFPLLETLRFVMVPHAVLGSDAPVRL